jgi:hypothetical protein
LNNSYSLQKKTGIVVFLVPSNWSAADTKSYLLVISELKSTMSSDIRVLDDVKSNTFVNINIENINERDLPLSSSTMMETVTSSMGDASIPKRNVVKKKRKKKKKKMTEKEGTDDNNNYANPLIPPVDNIKMNNQEEDEYAGFIKMKRNELLEEYPEISIEEIAANTIIDGKQNYYQQHGVSKNFFTLYWFELRKTLRHMSPWSKIFLIVAIVMIGTVFMSSFSNIIFTSVSKSSHSLFSNYCLNTTDIVECPILILFVFFSIFEGSEYHLITFILSSLIMTGKLAFVFIQTCVGLFGKEDRIWTVIGAALTNTVPSCMVFVCEIVLLILVVPVFRSFGWKVYRIVGTSRHLIRCYRAYSIFVSAICMDMLCTINTCIAILFLVDFSKYLVLVYAYISIE